MEARRRPALEQETQEQQFQLQYVQPEERKVATQKLYQLQSFYPRTPPPTTRTPVQLLAIGVGRIQYLCHLTRYSCELC